jgi:hypothetical protein
MTHYVNVPLSKTTYQRIKQLAAQRQRDVGETIADYLAETLMDADNTDVSPDLLADEIAIFEALKSELLETHPGEFVAIYQKQIVGFDQDEMNLIHRVYEQFGPVPCYVEKIVPETPRKVRMPSRWKKRS